MGTMGSYRVLTDEEANAVRIFANEHGRTWKAQLRDAYWSNARIWRAPDAYGQPNAGSILHALRNDPRWSFGGLDAYTLPKT